MPFEGQQLTVDRGVRVSVVQPVLDVRANVHRGDLGHPPAAKPRLERAIDDRVLQVVV
jgi:hypothetical protein